MPIYHENLLFTTLSPWFRDARATKIDIFWYPKSRIKPPRTPIEQPSGTQLADIADLAAKQPANEVPKYEDSPRARPTGLTGRLTLV